MNDAIPPSAEPDEAHEAGDPGVLGSLPRRRPGVRTPRRAEASAKAAARRSADADAEATGQTTPESATGGGIDDLARVGVTVAGEAAALGLRLAGHALRAIRGAAERR